MWKYLLFFFLFIPLFAEEEIIVHLTNEKRLTPIYLASIQDVNGKQDPVYLEALHAVLYFDLGHNGRTEHIKQAKKCKMLVAQESNLFHFEKSKWQEFGCEYVVKIMISDSKLTVSLFSVQTSTIKIIENISICGKLINDRHTMHLIADKLYETLFNLPGVCNTRIVYTLRTRNGTNSSNWITEVWEADYDGHNAHQITHQEGLVLTPTYVPNGKRCHHLLYVSYQVGQPKIFATSIERDQPIRLTYLHGNQLMPTLSPQVDKMAFISDVTGNPDLFIQNFSLEKGLIGKPRQIFSVPRATQGTPTFSPDGQNLAFVSNKDGTPRIYTLSIPKMGEKTKPLLISKQNRNNTCPAWSPDGEKIAYSAYNKGVRQIWIYDMKRGKEIQLTDGYGHKENPTWAPDSLHLIFNSSTPTTSELFLINLNQKETVKITSGPGEKRFPAWESLTLRKV